MNQSKDISDIYQEKHSEESFRDKIATVDKEGKRIWVYPKKPSGRYHTARAWVAAGLLLFLFAAPFIKIDGQPLLLFNILERKFVIFGQVFWPQDFYLFGLATITLVVFIILFTVVFGRLFCGWVCPQTIFMEFVFRKIEYWIEGDYMAQKKLNNQTWKREKILKKGSKHLIFLLIAVLIMHTFMAYIIGVDEVWNIIQSPPSENLGGFTAMVFFTIAFYWVFSHFREQVCTTVCPYGRLQGVLLDRQSVVVAYDYARGEPRAKFRKGEDRGESPKGDCIECKQCVLVCPTGIDIRNGTQLECINCTACMDACDHIMDKIDRPRGLIRYASEQQIAEKQPFSFTARMKAYTAVLVVLIGILSTLLLIRNDVESTILRTPGMMYQTREDGTITNLYQVKVINKTNENLPLDFRLLDQEGSIEMVGKGISVEANSSAQGALFVVMDPQNLEEMSSKIDIGVFSEGEKLEEVKTTFLGPAK
ncbi:MAG: cytochrome c oxidase accessory protein CcoG [Candidatus Cyclobacteriaceae bacterium M2_1C_046]